MVNPGLEAERLPSVKDRTLPGCLQVAKVERQLWSCVQAAATKVGFHLFQSLEDRDKIAHIMLFPQLEPQRVTYPWCLHYTVDNR